MVSYNKITAAFRSFPTRNCIREELRVQSRSTMSGSLDSTTAGLNHAQKTSLILARSVTLYICFTHASRTMFSINEGFYLRVRIRSGVE